MTENAKKKRNTLERYAEILEVVATSESLSLTQIAELNKLPKGTAHRLANALVEIGFLENVGSPRPLYQLGNRVLRLLHGGGNTELIGRIAHPFLESLANQYGESSFMTRLNGEKVEALIRVAPTKRLRGYVTPGAVMPPHAAASAKAILAYQPSNLIERILKGPLEKETSYTKTDPELIRSEYREIVKNGYAVCDRELDDWLLAIAAPVIQSDGNVFYAIAISGPADRLEKIPRKEITDALQEKAAQISGEIEQRLRSKRIVEIPN